MIHSSTLSSSKNSNINQAAKISDEALCAHNDQVGRSNCTNRFLLLWILSVDMLMTYSLVPRVCDYLI